MIRLRLSLVSEPPPERGDSGRLVEKEQSPREQVSVDSQNRSLRDRPAFDGPS